MKTITKHSLSLFFLIFSIQVIAQTPEFDKALRKIENSEGQKKVENITDLLALKDDGSDFMFENQDLSFELLNEGLEIAMEKGLYYDASRVHGQFHRYYQIKGDFANQLNHLFLVIETVKLDKTQLKSTRKTRDFADTYVFIGNAYKDNGNLPDALKYYLKAKKIYKELDYKQGEVTVSGSIGLIYLKEEKYDSAEEEFKNAIKVSESIPANEENSELTTNLAITYGNLGRTKAYQEDFAQAIDYLNRALEIDRDHWKEIIGLLMIFSTWRRLWKCRMPTAQHLDILKDAEKIFESYGDEASMTACQILEGKILQKTETLRSVFDGTRISTENFGRVRVETTYATGIRTAI